MKNILKRISIFFLCTIFIFNTCIATVYASESERPSGGHQEPTIEEPDEALWSKLSRSAFDVFYVLLAQAGCLADKGSFEDYVKNHNDFTQAIDSVWTKENVKVKTDSNGKKSLVFSKVVADTLLKGLKEANKEPDNGGYELVKTVPIGKISRLYFGTNEEYSTIFNLLKDNNGAIGVFRNRSTGGVRYYKIDTSYVWVKSGTISWSTYQFQPFAPHKSVNASSFFEAYKLNDVAITAKSWKDSDNLVLISDTRERGYNFLGYDDFIKAKEMGNNPFSASGMMSSNTYPFIITNSGATMPVFNSLNDAVEYSVAHNLYYTTSDFTGEGSEVTIDYDELDKILSGYYSGMYDMLQRLIEQNGGNALTPEQVQALADQVAESFDMLKAEINKGFEEQDALIQANSNILKAIKSSMEKGIADIKKLLSDMLETLKKLKNWTAAGTVLEGLGVVFDLVEFVKEFFDDVTVGVATLASGFTDTLDLVSKKFPFSIPWDIAFLVSNFADTPEAPVFEVPLKLPRYGIDEKFIIDFTKFEIISKISRSMLTMVYAMGLLKLTDKIINSKKGGAV